MDTGTLDFLKSWEGFRSRPYRCPAGLWTIGYGHTRGVAEDSPPIDRPQASQWLADDAEEAAQCIDAHVRVPLTPGQRTALVSFAFNVGVAAFTRSTLLKRLNAGDYLAAAEEFSRWRFAGGRELPGLAARRAAERALFLS